MYAIIDNLLKCANMLCGIVPITYEGADTDFLSFLLRNKNIAFAFAGSVLISIVLVLLFSVIMIMRTIASEKVEKTPTQIAVQVAKTLLTFLFIPAAMVVLISFTNALMQILYQATSANSPDGIGRFLAGAFGQNALKSGVDPDFYLDENFKYWSTSNVKGYLDLSDYDYFFSWLASIVILIAIGITLLMFVDRAFAIVILFIFAPISLSTSIVDDGARFKLWREQFLVKFLTGYGCIIGINIYALVVAAVTADGLVFFPDSVILNNLMKILIIGGGGVSLQKLMALVGNLIAQGAGSNEMRDSAMAAGTFSRAAMGAAMMPFKAAKGLFSATRSAINFGNDVSHHGAGTAIGRRLGFKTERDYAIEEGRFKRGGGAGAGNHMAGVANSMLGAGNKNAANAINNNNGGNNGGGNNNNGGGGNNNKGGSGNNHPNPGSNMISNAVNSALNKGGDKK